MKSLRVLVCGGNSRTLQEMAGQLSDEGVKAEISTQVVDQLCRPDRGWDLLLVDLDSLTNLLRGLLPAIRRQFPDLNILGIMNGSPLDIGYLSYDLELDGYMFGTPRSEDIIVRLPHLAGKYLCDTHTLSDLGTPVHHAYHELAA